jgi:uncharacterized protein (TIGR01777 family)
VLVLIAGASGLIGGTLVASLRRDGHEVRRLVRRPPAQADEIEWHPDTHELPPTALIRADAVVCLTGAPIPIGRPTPAVKSRLRASRVDAVATLAEAIAASDHRPGLIAASAVGYYGDTGEATVDESVPPGSGFLANLCRDWEAAADPARAAGTRVVSLRSGIVLARHDGVLARLRPLVWLGVAGRQGSGRQFVSWVSLSDEVAAIRFLLDSNVSGAVNVTAPNPVRNAEFVAAIARAMHRPAVVPVPALALRLVLGEFATDVLGGQRAVPAALTRAGFAFRDTDLEATLRAILT